MTTGLITRRIPTWEDVLSRLRSGEYNQYTGGGLCAFVDQQTNAYDVLGLIDTLAGASWEMLGSDELLCDDEGETLMPSHDFMQALHLNELVDPDADFADTVYGSSLSFWWYTLIGQEDLPTRADVLVYLNDMVGMTFEDIADEIERLGWNA